MSRMAVAPAPYSTPAYHMDVLPLPQSVRLHHLPLVLDTTGRFLSLASLPPCAARPRLLSPPRAQSTELVTRQSDGARATTPLRVREQVPPVGPRYRHPTGACHGSPVNTSRVAGGRNGECAVGERNLKCHHSRRACGPAPAAAGASPGQASLNSAGGGGITLTKGERLGETQVGGSGEDRCKMAHRPTHGRREKTCSTTSSCPSPFTCPSSSSLTGSKRTEAMLKWDAEGTPVPRVKARRRRLGRVADDEDDDGEPSYLDPPLITIPSLTLSTVISKRALPPSPPTDDRDPVAQLGLIPFPLCADTESAPPSYDLTSTRLITPMSPGSLSSSSGSRSSSAPCSPSTGLWGTGSDMPPSLASSSTTSILGLTPLTCYTRAQPVPTFETPATDHLTLLRPKTGSADLEGSAMKGWPLLFHQIHSDNIQLSLDRRRAKRFESFCKGICFSNRPVTINERVYLKFSEVSTSWSGVVRFGFTSHDPSTLNGSDLPRYACPDLTNKPGYWAKAVPERFAEQSNTLYFFVTRSGDVMFGLNNEDKGLFFSGVNTSTTLFALVDIYGNSTSMEFVDGRQLNNLSPSSGVPASDGTVSPELMQAYASIRLQQPSAGLSPGGGHSQSMPSLPAAGGAQGHSSGGLPIRFHNNICFTPMPLHAVCGRNVCLSSDKSIAVRLVEEYCNGYVFTARPLHPGEHMVIQILSVDTAFVGGLAFGMTACDPLQLNPQELPDDSDLLLDRPEYWVVNKDVCSSPVVGDELSFHLTDEGEVRYGKNGHHIVTLMHVDKTLPLWAFFDVYGSTQKIKSLGIVSGHLSASSQHRASIGSGSGLTVALPPPRQSGSPSPHQASTPTPTTTSGTTAVTPPPRPPPPRNSPSSRGHSHHAAPHHHISRAESPTPPSLPPKQFRPLPAPPPPPGTMLQPTPAGLSAVPPAVQLSPQQLSHHQQVAQQMSSQQQVGGSQQQRSQHQQPPPPVAPRTLTFTPPSTAMPAPPCPIMTHPGVFSGGGGGFGGEAANEDESDEAKDNASNECSVCFENAVDCVLYTCGHMCLCYDCAVDIKDNQGALCPICRQAIKDIIKIYRS